MEVFFADDSTQSGARKGMGKVIGLGGILVEEHALRGLSDTVDAIASTFITVLGSMNNLLPTDRKLSFASAVPFGSVLPPMITDAISLMSPVPNPYLAALFDHRVTASRTHA